MGTGDRGLLARAGVTNWGIGALNDTEATYFMIWPPNDYLPDVRYDRRGGGAVRGCGRAGRYRHFSAAAGMRRAPNNRPCFNLGRGSGCLDQSDPED